MRLSKLATARLEAAHTWRLWRRDGRMLAMLALVCVCVLAAALIGQNTMQQWQREADAAAAIDRQAWLGQGEANPHSVAHFGQYAFKPAAPLQWFDPGVSPALGVGVLMEAHYQNPATLRPIEASAGEVLPSSAAALLQWGLPLLLVVAGAALWAGEREARRLPLQAVQGARTSALLLGKAFMLVLLASVLCLPLALLALGTDAERGAWLSLGYGLYALIWIVLTLVVSMHSRDARTALASLLGLWLIATVIGPRLATNAAAQLAPLPSPEAFWAEVRAAQASGIDGHSSSDERAAELLQRTLAEYGVATEEELPVSFTGIAMQAGEEHANSVYDHHYGRYWAQIAAQDRWRLGMSVFSPLLALDQLSQWAAGSDWHHHRHFAEQAETHRRELQRFLNDDFTRHAKGQDFGYLADAELWAKAPKWAYQPPETGQLPRPAAALAVLLAWLIVAMALLALAHRRAQREVLP